MFSSSSNFAFTSIFDRTQKIELAIENSNGTKINYIEAKHIWKPFLETCKVDIKIGRPRKKAFKRVSNAARCKNYPDKKQGGISKGR